MKILITGVSGMLGQALLRHFSPSHQTCGLSRGAGGTGWISADLTNPESWRGPVREAAPDVIIHTAACTDVDFCEKNPGLARALNTDTVGWLADAARELGARFVHISTDAVFDGKASAPYTEASKTSPIHEYGRTKLDGENRALRYEGSLVLRTNIFGWRRRTPLSFGEWVLQGLRKQEPLTMFTDVYFTPLFTGDVAKIIDSCVSKKASGLFNAGSSDVRSKYDFAVMTAEAFGLSQSCIKPIKVAERGLTAPRSPFMALDSSKLENLLEQRFPGVQQGIQAWKNGE